VCHVIRDHEELKKAFAGPRFFIKIAGLDMHPLDTVDRTEFVGREAGIGLCNITKCCTEVCPENIHITDNGIIPMKERMADNLDPVVRLIRRIRGMRKDRV
jgi:succinate dehydrogenase / fumarate reductase iron-sulfur subunit